MVNGINIVILGNSFIQYLQEINGLQVVINHMPFFLGGALLTLEITALSVFFGMIIGLFFGLGKMSNNGLVYSLSTTYIDFIRGTPLFVQILLLYFGILPLFADVGAFVAAVIACSLNSGAYIAEIVRAGIQAIDRGQVEAARSLGMTQSQAMRYVVLPQAYKVVIPPLINEFIAMLKDTSLVSIIAASELTHRGKIVYSVYYEAAWVWGTIALIYFVMTKCLSMLGDWIERRLANE